MLETEVVYIMICCKDKLSDFAYCHSLLINIFIYIWYNTKSKYRLMMRQTIVLKWLSDNISAKQCILFRVYLLKKTLALRAVYVYDKSAISHHHQQLLARHISFRNVKGCRTGFDK